MPNGKPTKSGSLKDCRRLRKSLEKKLSKTGKNVKLLHVHLTHMLIEMRQLKEIPLPYMTGVIPWLAIFACMPQKVFRKWKRLSSGCRTELDRIDMLMDVLIETRSEEDHNHYSNNSENVWAELMNVFTVPLFLPRPGTSSPSTQNEEIIVSYA